MLGGTATLGTVCPVHSQFLLDLRTGLLPVREVVQLVVAVREPRQRGGVRIVRQQLVQNRSITHSVALRNRVGYGSGFPGRSEPLRDPPIREVLPGVEDHLDMCPERCVREPDDLRVVRVVQIELGEQTAPPRAHFPFPRSVNQTPGVSPYSAHRFSQTPRVTMQSSVRNPSRVRESIRARTNLSPSGFCV